MKFLNKTKIYEMDNVTTNVAIISVVILSISIIFMAILIASKKDDLASIFLLIALCSLIAIFITLILPEEDSGRYTYKCTISEDVNFNDIYENYNVIGQEGKIWTLEDKEVGK